MEKSINSIIDRIVTGEDKHGNVYFCKNGIVTLNLIRNPSKNRKIGEIYQVKDKEYIIFKKREKPDKNALHWKSKSVTIPYHIYSVCDGMELIIDNISFKILFDSVPEKDVKHFIHSTELKCHIPFRLFKTNSNVDYEKLMNKWRNN